MLHQLLISAVHMTLQKGNVDINSNRCKGCGLCVATCPGKTLALSDYVNPSGYHYSEQKVVDRCIGCASCALVCPEGSITVRRI